MTKQLPTLLNRPFEQADSLMKRLVAGVIILNVVVAGMVSFSLQRSKQNYDERAAITAENISQVLDENIHGVFSKIDMALQGIVTETERQLADGAIQEAALNKFIINEHAQLPELAALRATDASGVAIYGTKATPAKTASLAHRDYFILLRDTANAGLVISKPLLGGISGKWMIIFARRINRPDGAFAGLAYAGVTIDSLAKSFSKINIGAHGTISLIDSGFSLVARHPAFIKSGNVAGYLMSSPRLREQIQAGKISGTYLANSSLDSVKRIYSFRKILLSQPFYVVVGLAIQDYLADWRMEVVVMSLFLLVFVVITALSTWLFRREWRRNREIERAAMVGEQRFRSFVENANDIVFSLSTGGRFTYVSPNWQEALGYERAETIGQPIARFVHSDDAVVFSAFLQQVVETGVKQNNVEYRVVHKNGALIWYSANGSLFHDPENGEVSFLGIGRDISELKEAEAALRNSEGKFSAIFRTSPDSININRLDDGVFVDVNKGFDSLLGYGFDEVIGRSSTAMGIWVDPEDRSRLAQQLREQGSVKNLEARLRRKNGSILTALVSSRIVELNGELCTLNIARDISDRKQAEQDKLALERQFLQAQKLESLGIMAGGIAHDFNNLLQSILGNMELAERKLAADSELHTYISDAIFSGKAAAHLTNLMLTYVGKSYIIKRALGLNELVRGNAEMFRTAVSSAVSLELSLGAELPDIMADEAQIQQVIMNLITNAAESIDKQPGLVKLATGILNCDQACLAASLLDESPEPGCFVYLEVSDNGCGMDAETIKRLFDPFFTTKFTGRGLGMSAVMGIIRSHSGAMFVKSEPGKGTTFKVLFPVAAAPLQEGFAWPSSLSSVEEYATPKKLLSGVALVVDDEKSVLRICGKMIRICGLTVITACDGVDAVKKFREHAHEIVVVLMDLTMPNMDGVAAMNIIYGIRPDTKVILASGYSEEDLKERITSHSPSGFIRKPYNMRALETELLRVIGS
jgi:PAS domain S-box-containing protein